MSSTNDRLLVTVEAASRPLTMDLPSGPPVADLLPGIVRASGGDSSLAGWSLRLREGDLVDPERNLRDSGLRRGSVLRLVPPLAWPGQVPDPDSSLCPGLMARLSWLLRLRMAVSSARNPPPEPPIRQAWPLQWNPGEWTTYQPRLAPPAGAVDPRSLTEAQKPGALSRATRTWRASDYAARLRQAVVTPQSLTAALIAVVALEPASGTTTVAALLGAALSHLRRERVVIVDAGHGGSGLTEQLAPGRQLAGDLLAQLGTRPVSFTEFEGLLARGPETTAILPAPQASTADTLPDARTWAGLFTQVMRWMPTVIVDVGHDVASAASEAALAVCEFAVLVTSRERSSLDYAAPFADSLRLPDRRVVLVANHLRAGLVRWRAALSPAGCPLISLPHHRQAPRTVRETGPAWSELPSGWQIAGSELAAVIMAARR
jgi:hypothetical protein